jgi:uncharacterized membrane protein
MTIVAAMLLVPLGAWLGNRTLYLTGCVGAMTAFYFLLRRN